MQFFNEIRELEKKRVVKVVKNISDDGGYALASVLFLVTVLSIWMPYIKTATEYLKTKKEKGMR